ncbi:hypothetical protein DFH09DRAFT_1203923 [Mycena vulgaris]|nr:hypothetical protein DFH09DRAFT_1203923 [Mycena vulgaris]
MSSLLERVTEDSRYALATAIYPADLSPTRDRSTKNGDLYTFKDCTTERPPTATRRGRLYEYSAAVFGEVDCFLHLRRGIIVRFKCPDGVSCAVKALYRAQLQVLRKILESDSTNAGGVVSHSWFQSVYEFGDIPVVPEDTFYATIRATSLFDMTWLKRFIEIGDNIELSVGMRRTDTCNGPQDIPAVGYELTGSIIAALSDRDLPPVRVQEYSCDVDSSGCEFCI